MRSIELFSGAGGLAMGITKAGFKHDAVVEWDRDACATIRENQRLGVPIVQGWPVHEMDVNDFDYSTIKPGLDLLAGGPPCQPFSLGGKHKGKDDARNMFPAVFHAIRATTPRALIFENVKGLLRQSFSEYFGYIILQMKYPECVPKKSEDWQGHLRRLRNHDKNGTYSGLKYDVKFQLMNAADYGVPQRRERVVIVGFRSDLGVDWSYPEPTHSKEALALSKWHSGEYWDRHEISKKARPQADSRTFESVRRLLNSLEATKRHAWKTVRDAIGDLPNPDQKVPLKLTLPNHIFQPGARSYPGHTGSPLDEPAKTLKAGDHGVPGGENMIAFPDGSFRYFTVRESAHHPGHHPVGHRSRLTSNSLKPMNASRLFTWINKRWRGLVVWLVNKLMKTLENDIKCLDQRTFKRRFAVG